MPPAWRRESIKAKPFCALLLSSELASPFRNSWAWHLAWQLDWHLQTGAMEGSPVLDFYSGRDVLVTGATGFLGKVPSALLKSKVELDKGKCW